MFLVDAGPSTTKICMQDEFFIDLVANESLIKERAPPGLMILWTTDVAAGEPRLPQRFRQNRAWIELKKIWRTKKNVKGFSIKKIKGGYSVAIAGFITFLPFKKALHKKRIANDRFTIDSIKPTRRDIAIIVTSGLPCQL
ncbi:hypothetical protein ZWY2020_004679 [Hordeum vulgare]|nr:hypothetical protein ZWY2020_004679 [Hordeum vulgare]